MCAGGDLWEKNWGVQKFPGGGAEFFCGILKWTFIFAPLFFRMALKKDERDFVETFCYHKLY